LGGDRLLPKNIIGIVSDFDDYYIGILTASLYSRLDDIFVVNLGRVREYNVLSSIFIILSSIEYFRKGSIFLSCVDPEPLTSDYIVCDYNGYYIIGPNNGVFSPFLDTGKFYFYNIDEIVLKKNTVEIISAITVSFLRYLKPKPYDKEIKFINFKPKFYNSWIEGNVFFIDSFGNVITNIPNNYFDEITSLFFNSIKIDKYFGFEEVKEIGVIKGSQGFLEIVANKKSAKDLLKIEVSNTIKGVFGGRK